MPLPVIAGGDSLGLRKGARGKPSGRAQKLCKWPWLAAIEFLQPFPAAEHEPEKRQSAQMLGKKHQSNLMFDDKLPLGFGHENTGVAREHQATFPSCSWQ